MNQRSMLFTLTQLGLAGCAVCMAFLVHLPLYGFAGLAIASFAAIAGQIASERCGGFWKWAWAGTLPAMAAMLEKMRNGVTDDYYALLAGQISLALFITGNRPGGEASKTTWNVVGICWGFFATIIDLAASYLQNATAEFWVGLAAGLFLLVLCRVWFRLGAFGVQSVNTLILLLILLSA